MPVRGYLSKIDSRNLTMPRADEGVSDASGLAFHGSVLTGRLSVQEAFAREAARRNQAPATGKRAGPEDYDPVLKFHLGIE